MKDFKVLFIYPNEALLNPPPVNLGLFTSLLRSHNIEVAIFDTTFYKTKQTSDESRETTLQLRPFEFDENKILLKTSAPEDDLRKKVEDFEPDLIAMSVLEATWEVGKNLLEAIEGVEVPIIVGGVFATFGRDLVLNHRMVDMINLGEGEGSLVELCLRLREGRAYSNIKNLWIKKDSRMIKNPVRKVVDINQLPIPDYTAFDKARFLRPMAGRVYRTIPLETNRGCPYTCTFCNSPSTMKFYQSSGAGKFFRKKNLDVIQTELRHLVEKWEAEYVYFLSDTFLVMPDKEFDRFIEIYSEFKLPFWIQSRAEDVTKAQMVKLKEVGCHRMSIGLEHGNEDFRHRLLKKRYKNEQIIKAAEILHELDIPLSVNNIIGFPDETRELVFDTIELNRKLKFDTTNAYAFTPFHGTPLHQLCVDRGWRSQEEVLGLTTMEVPLDMPGLSRKEIEGLRKTFALYTRLPKEYWPKIEKAEKDDAEGRKIFKELSKLYIERYF